MFSYKSNFWTAGSWTLPFIMKPGLLRIQLPVLLNSFPWPFPCPQARIQSALEELERKQKTYFLSPKKIQNYLFSASLLRYLFRCSLQNFSALAYILHKQDFLLKTLLEVFLEQFAFIQVDMKRDSDHTSFSLWANKPGQPQKETSVITILEHIPACAHSTFMTAFFQSSD